MRSCALTRCVHRVGDLQILVWMIDDMSRMLIGWALYAFQILRCQKCQACFGRNECGREGKSAAGSSDHVCIFRLRREWFGTFVMCEMVWGI